MALVAYSDESDISDSDEENQKINSEELNITEIGGGNEVIQNGNLQHSPVKIEKADDVPEAADEDDVVNDVPTVQTWNIIKNKEQPSNTFFKKDPKSKKLKLVLPALSEFDDDDDEDSKNEDTKRKKIRPSSHGTGLFAVLPKPKSGSVASLVPLHVSKKMANKTNNVKKEKPKKLPENKNNDSDEEWDSNPTSDFFSLEKSDSPPPLELKMEPVINVKPKLDISQDVPLPSAHSNYKVEEATIDQPAPFINDVHSAETSLTHVAARPEIDTEALRRLTGRRNLEEVPNIIDINADDALMSKDEWIKRALCDEKPKTSFSRKKEGIPTQQQKRKHQITYLAHQAQEREQDLQNTWGQNRFTKLQTRSRYGF